MNDERDAPTVSVIVPTHNRPDRLPGAIESVLASTWRDIEVLVVDDASDPPARYDGSDPRVRIVRLDANLGPSGARNAGIAAARGRWIAFCDDDDRWRPHMLEASLDALARSSLPPPVAAISGIAVIDDGSGDIVSLRSARSRRLGEHFMLDGGGGHMTKQTLVVEKRVLVSIGGFDETFPSRVFTELFLRLNPVCSLQAVGEVGYEFHRHAGPRVSNTERRQTSVDRLLDVHADAFAAHPSGAAHFLVDHAAISWRHGDRAVAVRSLGRAARFSPRTTFRRVKRPVRRRLRRLLGRRPTAHNDVVDLRRPPTLAEDGLTLLAFGPLRWESGLEDLLVAVDHVRRAGASVRLVVESDGDAAPDIERFLFHVFDMHLADVVRLDEPGRTAHADVVVSAAMRSSGLDVSGRRAPAAVLTEVVDGIGHGTDTTIERVPVGDPAMLAEAVLRVAGVRPTIGSVAG